MTAHGTQSEPPIRSARPQAEQIDFLVSRLAHAYSVDRATIHVVRAPLRICPLEAHIDHQLGIVTGMAIDQSILMAFASTADGSIQGNSLNFESPIVFNLNSVPPSLE